MNRNKWLTRLVCVALISILNVHLSVASAQEPYRAAKTNVTVGGNIFGGGNNATVSGNSAVLINQTNAQVGVRNESGKLVINTGSVYGGGALANVGTNNSNTTTVTLTNGTVQGSVYGGGLGDLSTLGDGHTNVAALVNGNVTVTVNGGIADSIFGCNNLNGAPQNSVQVNIESGNANYVFGGGNVAAYTGTPDVNVSGGQVYVVYGGGNEAGTGGTDVALSGTAMVVKGIYGGCNTTGTVTGNSSVSLTGGQVGTSTTNRAHGIFGGGYGQPTRVDGNVTVTLDSVIVNAAVQKPLIYGNIYGGSALGSVNTSRLNDKLVNLDNKTTTVNVMAGSIYGEVYGGGLGDTAISGEGHSNVAALVHGVVTVNIGSTDGAQNPTFSGSALIRGSVYGCNNVNGSPQDDVHLNIYKIWMRTTDAASDLSINRTYALDSVFGGGHNAHYLPEKNTATSGKKIYTHVYGCDNTIKEVFGGGNAADAVGVNTVIEGGRYKEVFGGGNGVIKASNIGQGKVYLAFKSGHVGVIFGACNRQGTVYGGDANITIEEGGGACGDVVVDYHFCGGNYTDVIAEINQTMTCAANDKYLGLYGGCRLGTVYGNVTLTIEGGTFDEVYGGSLGAGDYAANIRKYPTEAQVRADLASEHPRFSQADLDFIRANPHLQGTGGNITVILKGGKIGRVFGGCDQNGNVEGKIIIIIDSTAPEQERCALDVDYVYGGCNLSAYRPIDSTATTPIISLVKGHVNHDVFGGGRGTSEDDPSNRIYAINAGLVTSNPKILMGVDQKIDVSTWTTNHTTNPVVETIPWTAVDAATDKKFWVKGNIYGGGEMARVGVYSTNLEGNLICNANTGKTTVEIAAGRVGPRVLKMPMDSGMVFGAGKGIAGDPATNANIPLLNYVNNTEVIIGKADHSSGPLIKGSVYGGSQNGHVLGNTWVKIQGGQIGCGWDLTGDKTDAQRDLNRAYNSTEWDYSQTTSLHECNSWTYASPWAPYDKFANETGELEQYPDGSSTEGGRRVGSDGHTFYGNVFGGGSGYFPYAPGKWLESAGVVYGNTVVDVTGGHILTSLYGGNEQTDVKGNCTVNFSGGTLGVPRTLAQIDGHPVTCYLFGAGKGDQRSFFNTWTNVSNVTVNITGGWIYGSIFGGGEDGHVTGNVTMTVSGADTKIGTLGTSYVDGNVFGGGRGFSGEALTAGVVAGNINVTISGGTMLGSIYGGGRLASVGTYLVPPKVPGTQTDNPNYGKMQPGAEHGNITVTISGGTIGNDAEYVYIAPDATNETVTSAKANIPKTEFFTSGTYVNRLRHTKGGNVFAGSMGRIVALDGSTINYLWPTMGRAKSTTLTISGGTIKSNVYGGGEMGSVANNTAISITGGTIGTAVGTIGSGGYYFGSVYGGGYGSDNTTATANDSTQARTNVELPWTANILAGRVYGSTQIDITAGTIRGDVYGGGEMASVGYETPGDNGNTTVNIGAINKNPDILSGNATILGNVYGANNIAGTPHGNANVNIYSTSRSEKQAASYTANDRQYALANVFGGGHEANYAPENGLVTSAKRATVHVYGCDNTIEDLFGGGDAAAAHGVTTVVDGGRFARVFGGGNGEVAAADIGAGGTNLTVNGGTIDSLFGGSNILGSIHGPLNTTLTHTSACDEIIGVFFAGSNRAAIVGNLETDIQCGVASIAKIYGGCNMATITGSTTLNVYGGTFTEVYGGSKGVRQVGSQGDPSYVAPLDASISGDVTLNIYGGTIGSAFGGSDAKGNVGGTITVNVEESGTCALDLTNVYGGGNQAEYTPTSSPANSPLVNIKHLTNSPDNFIKGNVFGGGLGATAVVTSSPMVTIGDDDPDHYARLIVSDATTEGMVFGGGSLAPVTGNPVVIMKNAHSRVNWLAGGGDQADVTGSTSVTINNGTVNHDVYGGGALSHVSANTSVTLNGDTVNESLYGGARGRRNGFDGATDNVVANIGGNVTVTVNGGTVTHDIFGCNNLNGAPAGTVAVNVTGGTIRGVYGGGNLASASVTPAVTVSGGTVDTIFGGGNGYDALDNTKDVAADVSGSNVTLSGGTVNKGVYGGCNTKGTVSGASSVTITSGTIGASGTRADGVFGGGFGAGTEVSGNVTVAYNGGTLYGDLYGGSAKGNVNTNNSDTTIVNVTDGTIVGDVYGGGLGDKASIGGGHEDIAALVNGVVTVNIGSGTVSNVSPYRAENLAGNATLRTYTVNNKKMGGCVFGGNNINGSPQNDVTVNIWQTAHPAGTDVADTNNAAAGAKWAIDQVFGGGNEAGMTVADKRVTTYIHGCENTVRRVFGGGNAAEVQHVTLTIDGGRYDTVWCGGNGERGVSYAAHIRGNLTALTGGKMNGFVRGSNRNGNISGTTSYTEQPVNMCGSTIINEYTGGETAVEHIGSKTITLGCPGGTYRNVYAASKAADFYGDLTLIINGGTIGNVFGGGKGLENVAANVKRFTSDKRPTGEGVPDSTGYGGNVTIYLHGGTIENVFGGCDFNGSVEGKVTIIVDSNSDNNACKLVVHNIYGGGNEAAYTPTQGTQTYTVGVSNEVSINPTYYLSTPEIKHLRGTVSKKADGSAGNVFGGGKGAGATVTANPIVTIGSSSNANNAIVRGNVYGGGEEAAVNGKTTVTILEDNTYVDGDVYGGGDRALVTGSVDVTIGDNSEGPIISGDVYGGGALSNVNGKSLTTPVANTDNHTNVTLNKGTIKGNLYGGGLGNAGQNIAARVWSPIQVTVNGGTVNGGVYGCNNIYGIPQSTVAVDVYGTDNHPLSGYAVGSVFGGGNQASYTRTPSVEIHCPASGDISIGTVYGGGNGASVAATDVKVYGGNHIGTVYGGGNGVNASGVPLASDFVMVSGNTLTNIYGGTIGNVFGGNNTSGNILGTVTVNINQQASTCGMHVTNVYGGGNLAIYAPTAAAAKHPNFSPVVNLINGSVENDVFGGGYGADDDLMAGAITTANPKVVMSPDVANDKDFRVYGNIYGGGALATVGDFIRDVNNKPTTLNTANTGLTTVVVTAGKVGPRVLKMPADKGHVFGGGKGLVADTTVKTLIPKLNYVYNTDVTIGGTALVKGCVFGGSEAGHVRNNTHVTIQENCQIGAGWDPDNTKTDEQRDLDRLYTSEEWLSSSLFECNAWPYQSPWAPYDKFATNGYYAEGVSADGGHTTGTDGHTFYGQVFGGGSGYFSYLGKSVKYPTRDSAIWIRTSGRVEGNTLVEINGGHILTSAYGGNEVTDVMGKSEVIMTGGTLGVPRTLDQIAAHPVTCYLFGGGKGDQRIFFNEWTNVGSAEVTVSGGWVYGSIFGGGEDGHVLGNVTVTVSGDEVDGTTKSNTDAIAGDATKIGTLGTSYVDGNVFGGGRGFSGEALTAGVVGGNIEVNISGGTMLGSIYGGGRLASVGTYLVPTTDPNYGKLRPNEGGITHGYITVNISGGTIGNDDEYVYIAPDATNETVTSAKANIPKTEFFTSGTYVNRLRHTKGGNVYGGSMGRIVAMDGSTHNPRWPSLGRAKQTTINISGGTIKSSVYGGGEMGSLSLNSTVNITGGTIGTEVGTVGTAGYYFGSVYGGGYGSLDEATTVVNDSVALDGSSNPITESNFAQGKRNQTDATPKVLAGRVYGNTLVNVTGGTLRGEVFGGGEMASIGYELPGNRGTTTVNIGEAGPTGTGATFDGNGMVFGANNVSGTPYGNTNVHIYRTAHGETPATNKYPTGVATNTDLATNALTQTYALQAVYGGGNLAAHTPQAANGTTNVYVHYCEENTIRDLYGGGNAANTKNNHVIVDGGRIHRLFGGGNGETSAANVSGTARTDIHGGLIDSVFGGSNTRGNIGTVVLNLDNDRADAGQSCANIIGVIFGGGNHAPGSGGEITIACGDYHFDEIYGGANLATINGNVTLNIEGGSYNYVYGGSRGRVDDPATNVNEAVASDISGNVTLNLKGGTIANAFGGNNANGNIGGVITVNVLDAENVECPLNLTNLYGGSNLAEYTPTAISEGVYPISPIVNVKHIPNGITGNVFGGGKGDKSTVVPSGEHEGESSRDAAALGRCVSNPQVNIGDDNNQHKAIISGTLSEGNLVEGTGNVYGGGELAEVWGTTHVNMQNANSVIAGNIYGAGKGYTGDSIAANVNVDAYVNITGGRVKKNVYGGGELASVGTFGPAQGGGYTMTEGNTHVTITGGYIGADANDHATENDAFGNVYGAGYGYAGTYVDKTGGHRYTYSYAYYNYVSNTDVTIGGTARVYGSIFGGAENGHVWENTSVKIKDGEIGTDLTAAEQAETSEGEGANIYTGNVYGGGRGIDESDIVNHTHSLTAGRVFGNTYVEVTGGVIHHDVFGGGSLASVGDTIYDIEGGAHDIMGNPITGTYSFDNDMNSATVATTRAYKKGDPVTGTGLAHVRILGGRIGNTGHNEGSVFGSGRGMAGTGDDDEYYHMAYAHNTLVFIGDTTIKKVNEPSVDSVYRVADIRGAVFGGGANGHVSQNSHVVMTNGVIGGKTAETYTALSEPVPATVDATVNGVNYYSGITAADTLTDHWGRMTTGHHTFLGNVYAGGRGVDHNIDEHDVDHGISRYAGRVFGNAKVEVSGGIVYHSVFGGGSMASVGDYTNGPEIANMVAVTGTGKTFVDISGNARIGTNGRNNGRVFGGSRGVARSDGYYNTMAFVNITNVTVDGNAQVRGCVFGGGENGRVLDSTLVTITGSCQVGNGKRKGVDRWVNDYVGNVYGGGRGVDLDQDNLPNLTTGWVKNATHVVISGGHVHHNVFGGGSLASVGHQTGVGYVYSPTPTSPEGRSWVDVTGGLIGTVVDATDFSKNLYGSVYGAGRGRAGVGIMYGNCWDSATYVTNAVVRINYTDAPSSTNYITGNVYGGGFNGHVNNSTDVRITKGKIGTAGDQNYGSLEGNVFGGGCGEDRYEAYLTRDGYYITNAQRASGTGNTGIPYKRHNRTAVHAHQAAAASFADSLAVTDSLSTRSGLVYGNTNVLINAASASDVQILHHVYGGGANASVGDYWIASNDYTSGSIILEKGDVFPLTASLSSVFSSPTHHADSDVPSGNCHVTVTGGTIGTSGHNNGMVFGASRGEIGAPVSIYDSIAYTNATIVTIGTSNATTDSVNPNPLINGSVYGGGENGHSYGDATVNIYSGSIGNHGDRGESNTESIVGAKTYNRAKKLEDLIEKENDEAVKATLQAELDATLDYLSFCGNVYGGGCGTDKYVDVNDGNKEKYNPRAGVVYGNTYVTMTGGYVERAIYGGGSIANIGRRQGAFTYHTDPNTHFALSWPVEFHYRPGTGKATINVSGNARIGYSGKDNGDIFGASRGEAGAPADMAPFANVDTTIVIIDIDGYSVSNGYNPTYTDDTYYGSSENGLLGVNPKDNHFSAPLIAGSVYGGAENGHVIRGTNVTLESGIVGHSIYGGGKGKGTYQTTLRHITDGDVSQGQYWHKDDDSIAYIYSLTAGRVYHNTKVTMTGGRVIRNIYGGGNMASVGVGNYAGGPGDYREAGYGERWTSDNLYLRDSLLHTGHTYVTVTGGIVGILNPAKPKDSFKDDLPLGNVFGGCRGEAAPSVSPTLSPRHAYAPAFFSGYVNHAHVVIGDSTSAVNAAGPRLFGSVYGGGQDGHVRVETDVKVYRGEIGVTYTNPGAAKALVGVPSEADIRAGNDMTDDAHWVARGNVYGAGSGLGKYTKKEVSGAVTETYATSSGSVTCSTYVYIKGGTIHRNVYGGGALASIGPLVLPGNPVPQPETTKTIVDIRGGVIGSAADFAGGSYDYSFDAHDALEAASGTLEWNSYGSRVYGASRGLQEANPTDFATDWWTFVTVHDGTIHGSVFGGGELGTVKKDTRVKMLGGNVGGDLYGAGRGISGDSYKNYCDVENTYVTIEGGQIHGDVYGGARDGHVTGNTNVLVKGTAEIGDGGEATVNGDGDPGYWAFDGNVFGGGRGSGDKIDTDGDSDIDDNDEYRVNKTSGRVGGNTNVVVEAGNIHGSIFGGGRLALTGVDVNGTVTSFLEDLETGIYDSVHHGMATVRVLGGTIGDADDANLLKCDWSVGDVLGSGKGDIDNYEDIYAGRVMNSRVYIVGNATVRGSIFGGGEMAGIGWWDNNGVFVPHTGTSIVHIKDTLGAAPTIGLAAEFTYDKPTHAALDERTGNENPGAWTMYNTDGTILHTCTGNVYGASQGDVDITYPHWVSMARSRQSTVTIDGGTIRSCVYGGGEQGIVTGNTHVTINGGTIGTAVGTIGSGGYYFGDVYGAGYGSDETADNATTYNNDSTAARTALSLKWTADYLAGRVLGNATVDLLGGTVNGNVYGGGSMAFVGYERNSTSGNTYVNVGSTSQYDNPALGPTLNGSVFGANNYSGTPYGNTNVHIYSTAHTDTDPLVYDRSGTNVTVVVGNQYPSGLTAVAEDVNVLDANDLQALQGEANESLVAAKRYAIKEVFGGGNKANHEPLNTSTGTTLVYIHDCDENTVKDVYGGGNAAATQNNHVIIEGGHLDRIFGGGNGSGGVAADVEGTATTEIHGGIYTQVFGGSNTLGNIGFTKVTVDNEGDCPLLIKEAFGGGNNAPGGNGEITLKCGSSFNTFYAGGSKANLGTPENPVTLTLNVEGGRVMHLFGGCQGTDDTPANIYGDVIVNLHGGNVQNLYGGSDVNGNISGTITVNVDIDPDYECPDGLNLVNVYGGGRNAAYTPDVPTNGSPLVNIMNNRYKPAGGGDSAWVKIQDVFGGALGATARVTSYPRVIIGGFGGKRGVRIFGNVYGGGSAAPVVGNTYVMVRDATIGRDDAAGSASSGIVFGGGYGSTSNVDGKTHVGIFGLSDIKNNVYGGGNAGTVNGNTELQIAYQEQIQPVDVAIQTVVTPNPPGPPTVAIKASLSCATPGVNIRYVTKPTVQGQPSDTNGTLWNGTPFTIDWSDTLLAVAYLPGATTGTIDSSMIPSVVSFGKAAKPVIKIDGDSVKISSSPGVRILYTMDGSEPGRNADGTLKTGTRIHNPVQGKAVLDTVLTDTNQVVRAVSERIGNYPSVVSVLTCEEPTVTISGNQCTITGPAGSKLYYTIDLTNPRSSMAGGTAHGTYVNGNTVTFTIPNENTVVKAIAKKSGYLPSPLAAGVYRAPAAQP